MAKKDIVIHILLYSVLVLVISCSTQEEKSSISYPLEPLPLKEVKVTGGFWKTVIDVNRENTLPHIFNFCEESGRIENFSRAGGVSEGPHEGERYNDTDVFKAIEGASYHLMHESSDTLEHYIDHIIELIIAAQEEDGYLYTPRTIDPETNVPGGGSARWEDVWISHELYNAGHLYEAAVAWYEATGKRNLLDVALKNADLVIEVFNDNGLLLAPGHQEIEIGLIKLYKTTGNRKYLDQANFFLNQRGKQVNREPEPPGTRFEIYNEPSYLQYHLPVRKQTEAVGHAVRAMYMYSGMTDVGYYLNDTALLKRTKDLWDDVVGSKLYLTGGIGASRRGEAFSKPFDLPNETAYCETCAAAGSIFWNYRMFNLTAQTKYLDLLEVTLYNGFLSGVSLDGKKFFYPNPLESTGNYQRSEWFGVACCPGNVARVIPSISKYIYSKGDYTLYVNLFVESSAVATFNGNRFQIEQMTNYPQDGKVSLVITPDTPARLKIHIRIPGWNHRSFVPGNLYNYKEDKRQQVPVYVNGKEYTKSFDGSVFIDKKWKRGDTITFEIPMAPRLIVANDKIENNSGKVALVRGPLVYAVEGIDNRGSVSDLELKEEQEFTSEFQPDLLHGIYVIKSDELVAIPYYSWANRGAYDMKVWIPVGK